jgi:hypothetical protein
MAAGNAILKIAESGNEKQRAVPELQQKQL